MRIFMIRRLQPEPPKVDSSAQKSDKSKDSTEQESLAIEFKKLLERARGGVHGAHDEVVALGLALAQAVSTVKTQQVEIRKEAEAHDTCEFDDGGLSDEGIIQTQVTGKEERVAFVATSGDSGPKEVATQKEGPEAQQTAVIEGEDGPLLEESGGEILLDDEIVFNDLDELVLDQTLDGEVGEVDKLANSVTRLMTTGDGAIELEEGFEQVEAELLGGLTVKSAKGDAAADDEATQFYDDEEDILATLDPAAGLQGPLKQVTRGSKKEVEISRDLFGSSELENPVEGNAQVKALVRDWFEPRVSSGVGGAPRNVRENDSSARGDRGIGTSNLNFDLSFGGAGPLKERNGELFLQVTLLRQAYESLKAQTHTLQDPRARTSGGDVAGVSASQQTRASDTATAPRQSRYLSKGATQRMLERVESALKEAARTRDGKTISIKLDPVNLGQIKVDVSLREGALHARVTPQNKEVLQSLREHAHELQGALRRLGLNVERISVQVVGETFQQQMQDARGSFNGKSFQQDRNNMPGQERQPPENRFGNEFADVPRAGLADASQGKADHWIA